MEKGTLTSFMNKKKSWFQMAAALFIANKKERTDILRMAKDIASALHYLHDLCHEHVCIIHRDLKPDNIGFTKDMKLKVFDFGLATCIGRSGHSNQVYKLTGCTGTLRYMAPEVALSQPYNQKVEVYSFGILFWQMLTGKVPFDGFNKEDFRREVVDRGCRPKIPDTLPTKLSNLLTACWARDPATRPSFGSIITTLDDVLADIGSSDLSGRCF